MTSLFSAPISVEPPLSLFPRRDDHPVSRSVVLGDPAKPVQTNKFYANLMLGQYRQGVWALPYLLWLTMDDNIWGMSVSHTDASQRSTGPNPASDPYQFYLSPIGIRSFTFSATGFSTSTSSHSIDTATPHSVNLNLYANRAQNGDSSRRIVLPLVQGMGFVSAKYYGLVPIIGSGVMFRTVTPLSGPRAGVQKWRVLLEDGKTWIIYAIPDPGTTTLNLSPSGNTRLIGNSEFTGSIQITKLNHPSLESVTDSAAGAFPVGVTLSGNVSGRTGSYTFNFRNVGQNNAGALLMYALPHHMGSFNSATLAGQTNLALQSPTKGLMRGVLSNSWTMTEVGLPTNIDWLPSTSMHSTVAAAVNNAAKKELQQDMNAQSNLESMYFSGKALAKFAQIVVSLVQSQTDPNLAREGLTRVQEAMKRFTSNSQKYPLVYDRKWKGLVSSAMYITGDPNVDFGNSYYNDHHFHYGYFIYTAACIGYCERMLNNTDRWIRANKTWVNQLVRDIANPHSSDNYFPVNRAFDWWHGHSWAKGLFESGDGKDQESSSEDYHFAYGMRQWGRVSGDNAMTARGDLMLGIMRRTMNLYFLMDSTNTIHPAGFIKNKVTGILFENKVDHATYFGMNPEFIHGIHMIPLSPISAYIRTTRFVQEEWETILQNVVPGVKDGWKGILMANYGLINPAGAWDFFTSPGFQDAFLDPGTSKTWYLALIGGWFRPANMGAQL